MQKNRKWIIPVIVAIASLIFAAFIYFETTRPQSQLEQVKDKLDTTEKRWQEANKLVDEKANRGENIDTLKRMLQIARELYLDAENKWMHGDYDGARTSVDESYEITVSAMEEIPPPVPRFFVLTLIMVGIIVLFAGIYRFWPRVPSQYRRELEHMIIEIDKKNEKLLKPRERKRKVKK